MQQARHQLMALHEDFCVFLQEAGIMKRAFPDQSSLYRRQGLGFHIGCAASHSDRAACAWFWMLHPHALCLLFLSTSHTVALRHTDVLDIGELSSVSLCIVLFPDTVQTIFPLTDWFNRQITVCKLWLVSWMHSPCISCSKTAKGMQSGPEIRSPFFWARLC